MEQFKQWYQSLAQREKQIVNVAGALSIIIFLYWLIWQPIVGQVPLMKARVTAAEDALENMRRQAEEYKMLSSKGANSQSRRAGQSLNNAVTSTANQFRININDLKSQANKPDELMVYIDSAEFNQILLWLQEVEKYYQLETIFFDVDHIEEKPGFVKARIKFKDQA